jgi:hypothetical protein
VRPNGFSAQFLKAAQPIIRHDLMLAFDSFWRLDTRNLHSVNDVLLTLLPKSADANYRPISLIRIVGKLLSKVLANHLAPKLSNLVNINQSTFIKGHFIQDSFQLVQSSAKLLHARKWASLLLRIDIAKAFDYVAWPFLLEVLEHLGFPRPWRDWISSLLSTSSTRIIMNGNPGQKIFHARGLRQGDPLFTNDVPVGYGSPWSVYLQSRRLVLAIAFPV